MPPSTACGVLSERRKETPRAGTLVRVTGTRLDLAHDETLAAARSCNLDYSPAQLDALSGAIGYKAREDVARMGLAARGMVKAHIVDRAMDNMQDWRRAEIGDRMACPNVIQDGSWDRSLISAIRRTGTKTADGPSVHFVGLAMYAIMAQEGFMRRITGASQPCPAPQ